MKKTTQLVLVLLCIVSFSPVIATAKLVACVGNSNTYGAGLSNRVQDCYPAKLEKILQRFDPSWETRNFGVNGATVLKQGALPYTTLSAYNQALASEPDVVILCFGPNASRDQSRAYIESSYLSDYISIIDAFAELPSRPRIWICYPLKAFSGSYSISDTIIRNQIIPFITQAASERDLPIIDLYAAFEDSPNLYLGDGIHPNSSGTTLMAEIVAAYVTGVKVVPDFNSDGIVDSTDMCIMIDHWHTDYPPCDIAPPPFGDSTIDVQDIVALAGHLFTYPGTAAHWALDETEGTVASDSVGNNDGYVLGNATWEPSEGQVSGALRLDGIDDFISIPAVLSPVDGPLSVLVWLKGGSPGQAIISENGGPDWLSLDPLTGHLITELKGSGRGAAPLLSQTVISDDNWHRVGLVWDGSNRILYVDGVTVARDTQVGLDSPRNGLYIGCGDPMQPETFFSGLIDDVRIYNRAVKP